MDGRNRKQHLRLILLLCAVAAVERPEPVAAQLATGLSPPIGSTQTGGTPTVLLPPSPGPFGLPNPLAPPGAVVPEAAPAVPELASGLQLPAPGAGITTLQLYDPNAPAVLIQPYFTLGETFYDNVFYTSTNRQAAAETSVIPSISISADTPRFTGVLSGNVQGNLYVPSRNLNQISANLFGQGTGTVLPNRLFVDVNTAVTEASTLPGLGFVSPAQLPRTQRTLVFTNLVSPYLRESLDGLIDSELRYRFASTNYGQNTAVSSTLSPFNTNLANGILNEGTLTAVTGRDFTRFVSRLTIDASSFNSNSSDKNTQFSGYDDLQYFIKPNISALLRAGYQNIQYPFSPSATFAGPTWLAGGSLGSATGYGYLALQYGRVQGTTGFVGSANYQITPTLIFQADLTQGITSSGQSFQFALGTSTLTPSGAVVNEATGLPTQFYNPGVGLNNNVYRQHLYDFGLSEQIGRNTLSLFTYYSSAQPLAPPITAPTDSVGANFTWNRDIRPGLNGSASLGYTRTTNIVTVNTSTPLSVTSTYTANIGVNHVFARALTGAVLYTFTYQPNGGFIVNGRSGDIVANTLQFYLTKAF